MSQFNQRSVQRIVDTVLWKEAQTRDVTGGGSGRRIHSPAVLFLPGQNKEEEAIPPYSVVEVRSGSDVDDLYLAALHKPTATGKVFGLTGNWEIGTGEGDDDDNRGGYHCELGFAKYDGSTPDVGDELGPKAGQWTLSDEGSGFVVVGVYDSTEKIALVRPIPILEFGCILTSDVSSGTATAKIVALDDFSIEIEASATVYSTGQGDGIFADGKDGTDGIVEKRKGKYMLKQLGCGS